MCNRSNLVWLYGIELKFFNNEEQAKKEEDLYRSWFGDIIEDYRSYDLDIFKMGWQLFGEDDFNRFIQTMCKREHLPNIETDKIATIAQ